MAIVTVDKVQYGDLVSVKGEAMVVKDIAGPDNTGAYDLYLTDGTRTIHQVVAEPVNLIG